MNRFTAAVRGFGLFWWDFIVGDDWRIAAGVVLALAVTAVAATSIAAWWIVPVAVIVLLAASLRRGTRTGP